ncbi:hypothetical protein H0H92_006561 [Tricholoma furcatifolium]|nr:hypothetical protein H0H92_006561 [Tricholoma furcatifolium]
MADNVPRTEKSSSVSEKAPMAQAPAPKAPGPFSWVLPALKTPRIVKTWIRCCVTLAATLILMVSTKGLDNMGQAGFFACIVAVMIPPSMALSLFVLAIVTLLLGMCIGWAWGAAAMAAGLSVRSQALLAQQQQAAQAALVPDVSSTLQLQKFIFSGMFLDPRTSAVYGVFFFIGTFALGVLRAYIPKFALVSIFGSIVLDIMCSYGPLFPTQQYTLAKLFIIPTSYYVAIAITALILIFPTSLNHVWITSFQNDVLDPLSQILEHQTKALESTPSDHENWSRISQLSQAAHQKFIAGARDLLGQIGTIDLEFSVGRLGPGDLKRISNEMKSVIFRAAGLHSFQGFVDHGNQARNSDDGDASVSQNKSEYWDRFTILQKQIWQREMKHGHDFDTLVPIIAESSADLRAACDIAVKGLSEWFHGCNSGRWAGLFSKYDKVKGDQRHAALVEQLAAVRKALEQYRETQRVKIIQPFEEFFDPVTGQPKWVKHDTSKDAAEMFAARSLYICFVFSYSFDAFAERLAKFMAVIIDIDAKRPKPRIWAPSGFGKLGRKIMSKRDEDDRVTPLAIGTSQDPTSFEINRTEEIDEEEDGEDVPQVIPQDTYVRKNPDALPPTTALGRFFLRIGQFFKFFKSPEGIFGLRHAVVSLALWIPSVCSSTAWFYYGNRGLWALIMAQTGLAVYAGDQIAGFVIRIAGTVAGLLLGIAVWYIGAGHGDGNHYGIVIATTAFVAPFYLARLAGPPQMMMLWVMTGVTIVFGKYFGLVVLLFVYINIASTVVGFSWVDTHIAVLVNVGVGVQIGWKRALLVIIGFTAGFIVMMFPQPTSSRTLVRKTLAAVSGEVGFVLASEIEALLAEEARARQGYHEKVDFVGENSDQKASPKELRVRSIGQKALVIATRLQALAPSLQTAKLEPQLSGVWPHAKYAALYATHKKILSALMLFIGAFTQLDTKWCSILVHQTPFLNPNLLSDIFSNLSILSYALSGAHPLPPSLPRLRDRIVYHERMNPATGGRYSSATANEQMNLDNVDQVDGSSIGFEVSLDLLKDPELPAHATALVALSAIITFTDEMTAIVRDLCGEMTFQGFAEFQREFLGREEKAIGGGYHNRSR